MNRQWYAVSTKPHQEQLAELHLRQRGVETFCPLLKQQRVIRRKSLITTSPLFPGYLFVRMSIDTHLRAVSYSRGVRSLVTFGAEPAIVEDTLIGAIQSRLQNGCLQSPSLRYIPGQVVRIDQGPLRGLEAVFEREMPGYQRAILLLKTLSYQARVVVDLQNIVNL